MKCRLSDKTPRAAGFSPRGTAAVSTTSLDIERPRKLKHAAQDTWEGGMLGFRRACPRFARTCHPPRRLKHAAREIVKEKEGEMEALHAQKDAQIEVLKKRNGQLEARLAALEQIVGQLARQQEGGTR